MTPRTPRDVRESGQAVVMFTIFLVVLIGFMALLIDAGSWLWVKRDMQGDADAAALAAVRDLPQSAITAEATAKDYVETRNDDGAVLESFTPTYADMTARVVVGRDSGSPFAKLYGTESAHISATATARIAQVSQVMNLLPFAALEGTLEFGTPPIPERITFSPGHGQDLGIQNGHIGAIAPEYEAPDCNDGTTNSAVELEKAIQGQFTDSGIVACGPLVGGTVDTATGDRPQSIQNGFDLRFGSNDGTHSDLFADVFHYDAGLDRYLVDKPDSPRVGFIPIVSTSNGTDDWDQINGNSRPVDVVDYVMVYIGRIGEPGEPAYVRGQSCEPEPCNGQQIQVFLTPIRGVMTPNWDYETSDAWRSDSDAPVSISLVE